MPVFAQIIVVAVALFLLVLLVRFLQRSTRRADVIAHGERTIMRVTRIGQTGTYVGGQPEMEITLRLDDGTAAAREVTLRRVLDLGQIPRVGDAVAVEVDTRNPDALEYLGPAPTVANGKAFITTQPALEIDCALVGDPQLRIADVLSSRGSGPATLEVRVDSVLNAPQTVSVLADAGDHRYVPGERVYLRVAGDGFSVVPLSETGGRPLSTTNSYRLDVLVLGPQLLHHGATGQALITEARQLGGTPGFMREQGSQRWFLRMTITPAEGGASWEHSDTLTYSSPERAARVCAVGLRVPVRYSPVDHSVMMTDLIAMGLEDSFLLQCRQWNNAVANGTTNDL